MEMEALCIVLNCSPADVEAFTMGAICRVVSAGVFDPLRTSTCQWRAVHAC